MNKIASTFSIILLLGTISLAQSALTNDDIIAMINSGLSPTIIAAKIRSSETKFDTSAVGLKKLSDSKVPESVVVAMIERESAQNQATRNETKEAANKVDPIPEQGNLSDLKGMKKVFILTSDVRSRDKISKELDKKKLFQVVDRIEESDFVIKFESWEETRGATASTYGNSATVNTTGVRIGVLTVFLPSASANRLRLVYSAKETQRSLLFDHPAESTTKDFLKAYGKANP